MDQLEFLAQTLGEKLRQKGLKLVLAESCTGGMVAAAITAIPGSSAWFDRGFVTYSNQAKIDLLRVSAETLYCYGAVSEQTAQEMAMGALRQSVADIAASITGVAGPEGGTEQKPVGTVCFAWGLKADGKTITTTMHFSGNRQLVRTQAVVAVLEGLLKLLS